MRSDANTVEAGVTPAWFLEFRSRHGCHYRLASEHRLIQLREND